MDSGTTAVRLESPHHADCCHQTFMRAMLERAAVPPTATAIQAATMDNKNTGVLLLKE